MRGCARLRHPSQYAPHLRLPSTSFLHSLILSFNLRWLPTPMVMDVGNPIQVEVRIAARSDYTSTAVKLFWIILVVDNGTVDLHHCGRCAENPSSDAAEELPDVAVGLHLIQSSTAIVSRLRATVAATNSRASF